MKKLTVCASLTMLVCASAAFAGPTQTAQGIMVNLQAGGDFILTQNQLYQFNAGTATTYFDNNWDGNAPTVICTGGACGTAPAAPGAPSPNPQEVNGTPAAPGADQINECTFFNGGTLAGLSYTQTAQISTGVKGTVYTYRYTYNVVPRVTSVDPLTAWDLVNTTGGTSATINVNAQIAGESVVISNQFKTPGKFSFSLLENDSVTSRVQNLVVTVTDANNNTVATANPGSTLVFDSPAGSLDYAYTTNAGSNGATGFLKNGDALSILNTDVFSGNDNGGANGTDLAEAIMDQVRVTLTPGSYNVTLTGTIKDNTGTTSTGFNVTQQIHIIGQGCGVQ
jgi:hypothetical protein